MFQNSQQRMTEGNCSTWGSESLGAGHSKTHIDESSAFMWITITSRDGVQYHPRMQTVNPLF